LSDFEKQSTNFLNEGHISTKIILLIFFGKNYLMQKVMNNQIQQLKLRSPNLLNQQKK